MSIVKIIEVISEGESVEAAIKAAVVEASKTLEHIKQVNVEHIEGLVEGTKITKFRIHAKLSFVVHH